MRNEREGKRENERMREMSWKEQGKWKSAKNEVEGRERWKRNEYEKWNRRKRENQWMREMRWKEEGKRKKELNVRNEMKGKKEGEWDIWNGGKERKLREQEKCKGRKWLNMRNK